MTTLENVTRELTRLGATLREPIATAELLAGLHVYDGTNKRSWEKVDPAGQLVDVSHAIRTFVSIEWPEVPYQLPNFYEPDELRAVDFYGTSESLEFSDEKKRLVLYQFGYSADVGMMLAFDLFDRADDPVVYSCIDAHEVGDAIPHGTFSQLLTRVVVAQGAS
ncbi:MAG TPA: hypothetical protein VKQ32_12105 [Polyangia bacterium]|nr:hypothetical protein [Polyangia bacterium]